MTQSLLPQSELRAQFARRRLRQIIAVIPILAAVVLFTWLDKHPDASPGGLDPNVIAVIAFVVIFGTIIFSFFNWRCPSCNRYLGKAWNPKFCQKCGFQLHE
jgi:hypothetical protein